MPAAPPQWQTVSDHILPYSSAGILTGVIIGMARAIGETAPIITIGALTFIAFLPPRRSPAMAGGNFEWIFAPFTVMPIQMFNWTSRPEAAFQVNAAAAGFVLVFMTLAMNGLAIWLRYRCARTSSGESPCRSQLDRKPASKAPLMLKAEVRDLNFHYGASTP
jgi:phosphate transport system permease protein